MKGAVAAFFCAAAYFLEDHGKNFAGEIHTAGVVHEECFEGVAARSISELVNPDYVVIGEASGQKSFWKPLEKQLIPQTRKRA